MTAADNADRYDPRAIQDKWQQRWAAMDIFRASDDPDDARPRTYLLDMFPYPSATCTWDTPRPMRWAMPWRGTTRCAVTMCCTPSGGTHSACPRRTPRSGTTRTRPTGRTRTSRSRRPRSASTASRSTGPGGCRPATRTTTDGRQWLFLRFYERGLAYRADGYVNWCPVDQTVLANEQVINGKCERCGSEVIRRVLTSGTSRSPNMRTGCWRIWRRWRVSGPSGCCSCSATGSAVARELRSASRSRARPSPSRCSPPGRTPCTGRRSSSWRLTRALAAGLCAPEQRAALESYLAEVRKLTDIERQSADRGEDRRVPGPVRDQPGERRADTGLGG